MVSSIQRIKTRLCRAALMAWVMSLACVPAYATNTLDITTGLKPLILLNGRNSESVKVVIVFDSGSEASRNDAQLIKSDMDNGASVPGGLKIVTQLMAVSDIAKLGEAKAVFLADSISPSGYDAINNAASLAGALTISTDLRCVRTNKCVLGIVTSPRVEIYYSPTAADALRINFPAAFLMLVRQI